MWMNEFPAGNQPPKHTDHCSFDPRDPYYIFPAGSQTWQCYHQGTSFTEMKDTRAKGSWRLWPRFQKTAEAKHCEVELDSLRIA